MKPPHPLSIKHLRASATVQIAWDDGRLQDLPEAELRRACRCADCTAQRRSTMQPGLAQSAAYLVTIHPVGQYGIQLVFSDGHERGIYPWPYLRSLMQSFAQGDQTSSGKK
ncbi:DUF971 family protein [Herbaspirillum seropedicae]|uniref:DUF971 domain-containing protein n=1 Tax=Herbaspirillum seropedicae TaxID=964 RepID=UPI003391357F